MTITRICLVAVLFLPILLRADDPASALAGPTVEGSPGEVSETWGNPRSLPWTPVPPVEQEQGQSVAKISVKGPGGAVFTVPLDVARFNGREVEIRTRVRADSVSEKPKSWNGVKLALRISKADGNVAWPQFILPVGTFDWTDVDWKVQIPDNPVGVDLAIGLQNVSGTVWFDAIHISTVPGSAGPAPAPATITIDAATSPGPVNRLVFGQNLSAADTARIFSSNTTDLGLIQRAGGQWDPTKQAPVSASLERLRQAGVSALRYPGGSLVHNYDWHKAVGPLEARGDWKFGIDEYLTLCHDLGAEPIFTVSDYVLPADQMPANAAGLVEYLNAPATPDHPWAMKRSEWGHPDPYGVKFFELGNESDEGNMRVIPRRHYTPEEYAAYANATAAAMRAVDPSIKLGLVMIPGPGTDVKCAWNRTAIKEAGKSVDYLIVHLYGPSVGKNTPQPYFFQACMAVGEQEDKHLDEYRALALQELGHDLPLAVTEYNGPCPDRAETRLSYGVALQCADYLRVFLKPEHHVLAASYWDFFNGPFGKGRSDANNPDGGAIDVEPAYPLYRLWGQHLGTKLVAVHVDGPRVSFGGAGSVYPATGDAYVPAQSLGLIPTDGKFNLGNIKPGVTAEGGTGGAFALNFDGVTGKTYPQLARLQKPASAGQCSYKLTCEARFTPAPGTEAVPLALGMSDSRGWPSTRSAISIEGIGMEWKTLQAVYNALPDTTAVDLQARLEFGDAKVSGKLEVRGLKIEAFSAPVFPAYPLLTSCASLSDDAKTLHLIVFNKSTGQDIQARLNLASFHAASARVWEVNGPGFAVSDGVAEIVHGDPLDLSGAVPSHIFPAHSMTAIDFTAEANPQNP
jgi:alpha-L-arabinofuranosidase